MTAFLKIFFFFSLILTGRDPVSAAIGAVVSETAAEAMDKPGATHEERQKIAQNARLVGDTVAFLSGRDVASADSSGRNAVENNWLPDHLVEIDGQRALMKLLPEEIAAEGQKRLDLDEQVTIEAMKNPYLNMVAFGIAAPPLAPALNHAILSTSAYFMTNPTGLKVASLATKGAVGLGTGILAYDYGKTALDRGFGAAFARMQEDAGLMMSVPTEAFANAAKSAFSSAPQEAKAAKTLVQDARPIVTEGVTTTTTATAKPVLTPSTKIGETVVQSKKLAATSKATSKQVELDLGKEEGVVGKVKSRGRKTYEDLTQEQRERLPEIVGKRGPYGEMRKLTKGYGHFVEADKDMPWKQMRDTGIPKDELPSTIRYGSDHAAGETFGWKGAQMPVNPNKRQEMAKAIWNTRRELQQQGGDISGVMKAVKNAMEDQIKKYPGVFGKGAQK